MTSALLVDDDDDLARLLAEYLSSHQIELTHVRDGAAAIELLAERPFDVVLLDVMLPGIDGFEVCRRVRANHDVPIVMLTARGDDADRIVGLEIGADDYVPKPFNPRELLARVRAVLRRARPRPGAGSDVIRIGSIEIDATAHLVRRAGAEVALTTYEFRILLALARRAGETVTREELAESVRDPDPKKNRYDPSVDRSLDVHVSRLRQKLEDDPKEPRLIRTIRGVGYLLTRPA